MKWLAITGGGRENGRKGTEGGSGVESSLRLDELIVPLKEGGEERETLEETKRSGVRRGAVLRAMLAARHVDAECHARESSSVWTRGCRHGRPSDAGTTHECVRRERRHNARTCESGRCPEVGGGLTCGTHMQISVRELAGSGTSEHEREGAGQMRRWMTRSEPVVCARQGKRA
jgi:hypothetical protein